jgi:diguanylate cyclase (GGDEF)-like protein
MSKIFVSAKFLKIVFLVFIVLGFLYTAIFSLFCGFERKLAIRQYAEKSFENLDYMTALIHSHFDFIISDLTFLSRCNEVQKGFIEKKEFTRSVIETEFLKFSDSKKVYDQIRLLNEKGDEVVRINYDLDKSEVIPSNELQNKKSRYYFTAIEKLKTPKIYMSPFDLNIEHNVIEQPVKPMIRFAIPLFDITKHFKGAVVLNYLGNVVLNDIKNASLGFTGAIYLLNQEGYWLYNNENSDLDWGFMYADGVHKSFSTFFPEEWIYISSSARTQKIMGNKLITSVTISPLSDQFCNIHKRKWTIVNSISLMGMGVSNRQFLHKYASLSEIILPLFVLIAVIFARVFIQRGQYKKNLEYTALYDALTRLPNRNLLYDRLDETMKKAARYSFLFAIIFIDLDGFKFVNDSYGHEAGDELLTQVGQRLQRCVRESDTVSRYGGDEFVILLSGIENRENCETIAKKILITLNDKFILKSATVFIGGSIGIAISEKTTSITPDELITRADNAMYIAKKNGKKQYRFSDI